MTFSPGESLKAVSISILDDEFTEGTEYFNVSIEVLVNGIARQIDQTTVAIADNNSKYEL